MGKLEKLPDGRHVFRGGFSTTNPEDMKQLRGLVQKSMGLRPVEKKVEQEPEEPKEVPEEEETPKEEKEVAKPKRKRGRPKKTEVNEE